MANFVLVAGGWHGGWVMAPMARALRARGHEAFTPTLTGLGERVHLAAAQPNLETHIEDVANLLRFEDLNRVILCGHSFAGLVISGVADRLAERVAALVYVDAFVPEDGQSWWTLANDYWRGVVLEQLGDDGIGVAPPPRLDWRCVPHPFASFRQAIHLTGRWRQVAEKVYIYASGWADTPFTPTYAALKDDPQWIVRTLPCGHDVIGRAPEEFLATVLGLDAAAG